MFTLVDASHTKIDFTNKVVQDDNFNCIRYTYALIGGGVGVADINNDGLSDIYLVSNQGSNKLYLNKGNFVFEDITKDAGVSDAEGWSTGVAVVDINNDGWSDLYVCKSASVKDKELRRNRLFVNQRNGTFTEEAKSWGLDHDGFSIQSYFFDYDKDGDLDMYLVNHRIDFENTLRIESKKNQKFFPETSDHLFRNDGNTFTNVTVTSKIINKAWGLSAAIGDYNNDGWPDIYVANDYIAPDILYINNKDGTFSNQINTRLPHSSYNSMGSDYADINNDFLPDLMVLEMSAEDHIRSKENMPTMNTEGFKKIVEAGYHRPYMSNVLQLNNGNGSFTDIGQFAGVAKTDWSWAPLFADFDNDGFKDLLVSNGVERNFSNQDYARKVKENLDKGIEMTIQEVIDMMPSDKLSNYGYRNKGDLTFENTTELWGLSKELNSNGVAYADFDNDGDLDLVMNNLSDNATVYKNNSIGNYINIELVGDIPNRQGIGAEVKVFTADKKQHQQLYTSRGYLSAVSPILNFGLGDETTIDRIEVDWGFGKLSVLEDILANQHLKMAFAETTRAEPTKTQVVRSFLPIPPQQLGIEFVHHEENSKDFSQQVLLPQKLSQQGPALAIGDVNGDGLEDMFLGGAKNQQPQLFVQKPNGTFDRTVQKLFNRDRHYEDIEARFFDADQDGDLDLYVTSGSYEFVENSALLQDRLYQNDGRGNFSEEYGLPKILSNTKSVNAYDYDGDGDLDLFIGGYVIPGKYPLAATSYVLNNNKGVFTKVTHAVAPEFSTIGMVNDITFSDFDSDGDEDLWVVGEWMDIQLFEHKDGKFTKRDIAALQNTSGWWNTITATDMDGDGDDDYLVGNLGNNNKFHPSLGKPLHIYGNDFDGNTTFDMVLSKDYKGKLVPVRGKECSTEQNNFIKSKMATFNQFANATLKDIYGEELLNNAYHAAVTEFSSVFIENQGKGILVVRELPNVAQLGPTLSFSVKDLNHDGFLDVVGVGAIQETEVETIPYDGNKGYVLLGDGQGGFTPFRDLNFYNNKNAKRIENIKIGTQDYYVIANNNAALTIFKTE